MQHCSRDATTVAGTVGEGNSEDNSEEGIVGEETVDGEIVDEEVGYEETDFLDGSFSIQETKKCDGLSIVPKVDKSSSST